MSAAQNDRKTSQPAGESAGGDSASRSERISEERVRDAAEVLLKRGLRIGVWFVKAKLVDFKMELVATTEHEGVKRIVSLGCDGSITSWEEEK